jgi:hypothetical protein
MKLLTKEILDKLPKLYETEGVALDDKVAVAKFFHPSTNWTWFAVEFDGEDLFWGLVDGHEREFGYFSLKELQQVVGPLGLGVERDLYFKPTTIGNL